MKHPFAYYFLAIILGLGTLGYGIHLFIINFIGHSLSFSLRDAYLFLTLFTFLLYVLSLTLNNNHRFYDQLGFVYLWSVALKIILFCLFFYDPLFQEASFSQMDAVNMLIPIFLFLLLEVLFISKLLNQKKRLKKNK